jgi:hypothetical protein
MVTQSRDTHPEAEQVLIELLRKATPQRRLELGLLLSQDAMALASHALIQANPHLSDREQKLLFVEVTYGKELADRVRAYLAERKR